MSSCLVIDNGSSTLKVGLSQSDFPQYIIPTIVGRSRQSKDGSAVAFGDDANEQRAQLQISSPIRKGLFPETHSDWDDMESLWKLALEKSGADPAEIKVLLTEPLQMPIKSREKVMEIWFEKFKARSMASCSQPLLSLFATGSNTGVVVDIGDQTSTIVSIASGYPLQGTPTHKNYSVTGYHLTENLARLLSFRGFSMGAATLTGIRKEIVRDIKEKLCYVAFDPQDEGQWTSTMEEEYKLPDGTTVTLAEERYLSTEPLFFPDILGLESPPLHVAISDSVKNGPIDMRRELMGNIVLSGGCTMLPGFVERLEKEIINVAPPRAVINILHDETAAYRAWLGGAVLGLMDSSRRQWMHDMDYNEQGKEFVSTFPTNPFAV